MYLIRNKRTKEFIDNSSDWTLIRSLAKRFTKDEAQKFIDKHQTKNDDPYMEIISEGVQKHLKEYLAEDYKRYDNVFYNKKDFMNEYKYKVKQLSYEAERVLELLSKGDFSGATKVVDSLHTNIVRYNNDVKIFIDLAKEGKVEGIK